MSFQILQRAYAPYGTAAQFPASGDSRLIYRATDTGYLYTWDASESAYKLAGIDPATAPYLGLHAQADDAARLGGQLPSYYAQASHTHAQSVIDSSTGWITTALAGKQAAGSYLTATDTAAAAKVLYDENCRRIVSPLGGELRSSVASQAGAIKIMLPAVGMDYSMMSARVCVFEFATLASFEVHFQGYLYGFGNTWSSYPSAYIIGNPSKDRNLTLRFGYDSTQNRGVLYIGELTSQWSYPQVFVTDVQIGFEGNFTGWKSGWQIGYESAAFANVTATLTDCQVGFKTPNLTAIENLAGTSGVLVKTAANTWELKNGFTGAKVIGGTTYNFVNGLLVS